MSEQTYWKMRLILSAVMDSPLWYRWTVRERLNIVVELLPDF